LLCVWIVACIHGRWRDCVGAKGKGLLPSAGCLGVQLVLIMQLNDGWAFQSLTAGQARITRAANTIT